MDQARFLLQQFVLRLHLLP